MSRATEVIQTHADHEESIERIVKHLGRSKLRLMIFNFIHSRGRKPKTVSHIMSGLKLKPSQRQVVLNQINHLAKHKVVLKESIPAAGRSGTELAYGKNDFVMANKSEILKKNANPSLLRRTPTKRRPHVGGVTLKSTIFLQKPKREDRARGKLRVLYLLANPSSQASLRTDAEFRFVQDEIRGSKYREKVILLISPAADIKSMLKGINDHRPQIVHFSGHGGSKSIWLDDGKVTGSVGQAVSFELLAEALGATNSPPTLLVLNSCDTLLGSEVLLESVKVVIAMSAAITDIGATSFAAQFYAAIASAQPISAALKQGKISMRAASLSDAHLPTMIYRKGIDPKKLVLVS